MTALGTDKTCAAATERFESIPFDAVGTAWVIHRDSVKHWDYIETHSVVRWKLAKLSGPNFVGPVGHYIGMAKKKIARPNEERRAKQLLDRIAKKKPVQTTKEDLSQTAAPVVKHATENS